MYRETTFTKQNVCIQVNSRYTVNIYRDKRTALTCSEWLDISALWLVTHWPVCFIPSFMSDILYITITTHQICILKLHWRTILWGWSDKKPPSPWIYCLQMTRVDIIGHYHRSEYVTVHVMVFSVMSK